MGAALVAIALPSADAADLERIFNALDRRGGGTLLAEDFVRVLKEELQISTEEALQIFESVDQTGRAEPVANLQSAFSSITRLCRRGGVRV